MKTHWKTLPRLALALAMPACTSTRELRSEEGAAALELLKSLEGSWAALDESGQPSAEITSTFRVTAGGTAVEEIHFPGSEHEMITLYYVRDGRLQLTHYCMVGNQPHMLARPVPGSGGNELEFLCDGTGVDSEDAGHMHHARIRLAESGKLESRWQMLERGAPTHLAEFTLVRQRR